MARAGPLPDEMESSIGFPEAGWHDLSEENSLNARGRDSDPALELRIIDASVDCLLLRFAQPKLEMGFSRWLAKRYIATHRASFLSFAVFECVACTWNIISLFETCARESTCIDVPGFAKLFTSGANIADVVWISFHGSQAVAFFSFVLVLQCAHSERLQRRASAEQGSVTPLLSASRYAQQPAEGRERCRVCRCGCAANGTWVWQAAISLLWLLYQVIYYRIWHHFGVTGLITPMSVNSDPSSNGGGTAPAVNVETSVRKATVLAEAVGLTTMLVMACSSSLGGLRSSYVTLVQMCIFIDTVVETGLQSKELAFWPCFKVAMGCAMFSVFARQSELQQRTEYVRKVRLRRANIDANLEINPFTPDALRRWMNPAPTAAAAAPGRHISDESLSLVVGGSGDEGAPRASHPSSRTPSGSSFHRREISGAGGSGATSAAAVLTRTPRGALGRWEIPWARLRILSKVGGGGSGQVFCATYDSQPVAVKQLFSTMVAGEVEEFCREVSILAQLPNHPSILGLFGVSKHELRSESGEVGEERSAPRRMPGLYIVTEWVDGGDLEQRLRQWGAARGVVYRLSTYSTTAQSADVDLATEANLGTQGVAGDSASRSNVAGGGVEKGNSAESGSSVEFIREGSNDDVAAVIRIAQQVAAAMAFLHLNAVLHLDLKPANILITARAAMAFPLTAPSASPPSPRTSALRDTAAHAASLATSDKMRLVLSDFGLASSGRSSASRGNQQRYETGARRRLSGTPLYMSPELLDCRATLGRSGAAAFTAACKHDVCVSVFVVVVTVSTISAPAALSASAVRSLARCACARGARTIPSVIYSHTCMHSPHAHRTQLLFWHSACRHRYRRFAVCWCGECQLRCS